ncbi:MAG: hypothetical protein DLM59_16020 [Pseudonocardiales bacterium]|nr:MAG: hypothetical protein DLM59_16020 [Pseudonocardiales bacterium]
MEKHAAEPSLIDKLPTMEGPVRRGCFDSDYPRRRIIHSAARLIAFDLLNEATSVPERQAAALVDAAASLLIHGDGEESARLCLEAVTTPRIAGDVVRTLTASR